jgi:hypothetical protein
MLLAVLALPHLTVADTRHIIIMHLVGRARSTASCALYHWWPLLA